MFYYSRYTLTTLITLACVTGFSLLFYDSLELINIALIHFIPIIVIALEGNYAKTTFVASLSVLLFNYLYVPPIFTFSVSDMIHIWTFGIFLFFGSVITWQAKKIKQNEIKEILLNTLSHDLKTPLSSILGSITLLLEDQKLSQETQKTLLNDIKNSSDRMHRLINNLLDNARLKDKKLDLKMEWCDLEDLLGVALKDFDDAHLKRSLHIFIDPTLPLYWGDYNLLGRLFANLLDNAFKYSNQSRQIYIKIKQENNTIHLLFFNESNPLNEQSLATIFDKFYRAEDTKEISGSGIGLFICQSIVQAHQGKIKAYNKDNGVCFEITLPIFKHPTQLQKESEWN
ncbi:sensor histidine kinase [Sulfurospirillum deleyianum]|uniref:histidine kinase n=1 Tax=Sulfurospirillum deleyianum (strain ATCC 51133 / DSM 6946 / 5175) TaxID=525898 RepID=D1B308_SULD5|nr:ATP-binding protein [Sulfurospirillum deleyianum]ACZ12478.1 ATP-binding region ATPase domain protein [Sulfurospirillum deleyianum DSM 6946]